MTIFFIEELLVSVSMKTEGRNVLIYCKLFTNHYQDCRKRRVKFSEDKYTWIITFQMLFSGVFGCSGKVTQIFWKLKNFFQKDTWHERLTLWCVVLHLFHDANIPTCKITKNTSRLDLPWFLVILSKYIKNFWYSLVIKKERSSYYINFI